MNCATSDIIDNLKKDLDSALKQKTLLTAYLNWGGNDDFFSINDDNYGNGGGEILRLYDDCITLLEHTLHDAAQGSEINKVFLANKLNFYHITESIASIVMPNVFNK